MQAKIALVTASGRAYYQLVSALRKSRVPFITVKPGEALPLNVEVAITTDSEKSRVRCPTVLTYDEEKDSSVVVEAALQIIQGKRRYRSLVVGVDPGKDYGIAAVGDGVVLATRSVSGESDAAEEVLRMIERFEGDRKIVRIGNSADDYRLKMMAILNRELPSDVDLESVEEGGTTRSIDTVSSRSFRDVSSAVKISMRRGHKIVRGK